MPEQSRLAVVDGQRVRVFERNPPVPETLELMLEGGRDTKGRAWRPLRVVVQYPLRLRGARSACLEQDHRLGPWLEGFSTGSDLVTRYLHLNACSDCGSVCVRDASFDSLEGLDPGSLKVRRKDHVIGWYTGARPRQRTYT